MNFAVMKTMFGDIWVGRTQLPAGPGIYETWEAAMDAALDMNDINVENLAELETAEEAEAEEIRPGGMEKFIVGRE